MSDIITEAGELRFINRTRYNSEDIANLFLGWKEAFKKASGETAIFGPTHENVEVFEIGDYNPAAVWQKTQVWTPDGRTSSQMDMPHFVHPPGWSIKTNWRLGIVTPEKLHKNPLEALSSQVGAEHAATGHLPEQLSVAFISMFRVQVNDWRIQQEARSAASNWAKTQTIRIMKKRQNPLSSATRRDKLERVGAFVSVEHFLEETNQPVLKADDIVRAYRQLVKRCLKVDKDMALPIEELERALGVLKRAHELARCLKIELRT